MDTSVNQKRVCTLKTGVGHPAERTPPNGGRNREAGAKPKAAVSAVE